MSDIIEQAVKIIDCVAWVSTDETIGNPSEVVYALRDAGLLRDSEAGAAIEQLREVLSRHPEPCEATGFSCGWKQAVIELRTVLGMNAPEPTPEVELARQAIQAQMNRSSK